VRILAVLAGAIAMHAPAAEDPPPPQSFLVREKPLPPLITPFLQYQAAAWREDDDRQPGTPSMTRKHCQRRKTNCGKSSQMIGGRLP
jgi:hypothetical protein